MYPKTGSENPEDAKLLIALNYEPIRDNLLQPCIAELKFIMHTILVLLLGFKPEHATEYLNKRVIIINKVPTNIDLLMSRPIKLTNYRFIIYTCFEAYLTYMMDWNVTPNLLAYNRG